MRTVIPMTCQHCGRPIGLVASFIGGFAYHEECTRGAAYQYGPPTLTEADVRRIVRQELAAATPPTPKEPTP